MLVHNHSYRRKTNLCRIHNHHSHKFRDHDRYCIFHQSFSFYYIRYYYFQSLDLRNIFFHIWSQKNLVCKYLYILGRWCYKYHRDIQTVCSGSDTYNHNRNLKTVWLELLNKYHVHTCNWNNKSHYKEFHRIYIYPECKRCHVDKVQSCYQLRLFLVLRQN